MIENMLSGFRMIKLEISSRKIFVKGSEFKIRSITLFVLNINILRLSLMEIR